MNIAEKALQDLFPDNGKEYSAKVNYSGKFSKYNGNVKFERNSNHFEFSLSREWEEISPEIQMGLIQLLALKILKRKKNTNYIDLYNDFMRKIHIAVPKTEKEPILEKSFNRVNEKYFNGMIEITNLKWCDSINKLGSYEFGSDAIAISRILSKETELMDYVMYHEMLHKKHKFNSKNFRNTYHSNTFKKDESDFENSKILDEELRKLVRKSKWRRLFF